LGQWNAHREKLVKIHHPNSTKTKKAIRVFLLSTDIFDEIIYFNYINVFTYSTSKLWSKSLINSLLQFDKISIFSVQNFVPEKIYLGSL